MSYVENDWILRLARQIAHAIARIAGFRDAGRIEEARDAVAAAVGELLGSRRGLAESLDAASVVAMLGGPTAAAYARLLAVEVELLMSSGFTERATVGRTRALSLFVEAERAGHRLDDEERAERERLTTLE